MPRIPVFTSRVSTPAPNPGLGDDLAKPGKALAGLGGAIVGFGKALAETAKPKEDTTRDTEKPRLGPGTGRDRMFP